MEQGPPGLGSVLVSPPAEKKRLFPHKHSSHTRVGDGSSKTDTATQRPDSATHFSRDISMGRFVSAKIAKSPFLVAFLPFLLFLPFLPLLPCLPFSRPIPPPFPTTQPL